MTPTPPPIPPGGPGGEDTARISTGVTALLDEACQKLSPKELKKLLAAIKNHPAFKRK